VGGAAKEGNFTSGLVEKIEREGVEARSCPYNVSFNKKRRRGGRRGPFPSAAIEESRLFFWGGGRGDRKERAFFQKRALI